eukprot:RCo020672
MRNPSRPSSSTTTSSSASSAAPKAAASVASSSSSSSCSASSSSQKPAGSASASAASAPAGSVRPRPIQPKYEIIHRGEIGLQDAWNAREVTARHLPLQLVVRVELPDVTSAAQVDVDVTESELKLTSEKFNYELTLRLPFPVDPERCAAVFDKAKRKLSLTMAVVPPSNPKIEVVEQQLKDKRALFEEELRRQRQEEAEEQERARVAALQKKAQEEEQLKAEE